MERIEPPGTEDPGTGGSGYDEDNLGDAFGGLGDSEADFLRGLLEENEDAPGWPAFPRRVATLSDTFKNETALSVGAKGSFFDLIEAEATASVQFAYGHGSILMLVKTSELGLSSLTRLEDGVVYLNYEEGVDFVGQCAYKANLDAGARFVGKLTVSGSGVSNQTDLEKATEVLQSTNFFAIREGDTVDDLLALCEQIFDRRIKHSVGVDLRNLVAARISIDSDQIDDMYRAYVAAMHGPARDRLYIMGHHWNIEPAHWQRYGPGERHFRVSGKFERDIALLPNSDVFYDFEFLDGQLVSEWVSVGGDSGWQSVAPELARLLASEVYGEFRVTLDEIEPGDPPRALLGGQYLGVGHYSARALVDVGVGNDAVSVVTVPAGLRVRLFEHDGFVGDTVELGMGTHAAPFGVSSVWVMRDADQLRSYTVRPRDDNGAGLSATPTSVGKSATGDLWQLASTEDGYARLQHGPTGGWLAATDAGPILSASENASTEWAVVADGTGYALINRASGLALTDGGAQPTLAPSTGAASQRWHFDAR